MIQATENTIDVTTGSSEPETGIGSATSKAFEKLSEGDVSYLTEYATEHLAPALFYAALGLGVIFLGYLVASYLSRVVSKPVCRRVDETFRV